MPCYTPPPTKDELESWARDAYSRWGTETSPRRRAMYRESFMSNVTKEMLGEWLCDALQGNPPSEMCIAWWALHREKEGRT